MLQAMNKVKFTLVLQLLSAFIIIHFFSSCNDLRCIDGNNEMVTESRAVATDFNGVSLSSEFTVFITHSLRDSVSVEAESNFMPHILTEVKNRQLELKTTEKTCLNPRKPVIIRIYTNELEHIVLSGSGTIQADNIIAEQLKISVSGSGSVKAPIEVNNFHATIAGSGNIEIWGKATNSHLDISGSGNFESYGLDQDTCISSVSGSGNIFIYVRKMLDASISGSGSVYYKGNPELDMHISGSGKVVNQQSSKNSAYSASGSFYSLPSRSMLMIY